MLTAAWCMYLRYKQVRMYYCHVEGQGIEPNSDRSRSVRRKQLINKACLVIGIITSLGISIVANFQVSDCGLQLAQCLILLDFTHKCQKNNWIYAVICVTPSVWLARYVENLGHCNFLGHYDTYSHSKHNGRPFWAVLSYHFHWHLSYSKGTAASNSWEWKLYFSIILSQIKFKFCMIVKRIKSTKSYLYLYRFVYKSSK